jgi:hypothetical protein
MKSIRKLIVTAFALAALTAGAWAENPPSGAPANKDAAAAPAPAVVTAADVQALKDALASQQLQLQRLEQQLQRQQEQQAAAAAASKADTRPVPQQQVAEVNSVAVPQNSAPNTGLNLQDQSSQTPSNPMESPIIGIHFKGITISPGGFVEAAFVRRSRELGADLPTPFNSLTLPGASQSQLSEFFGSARQSRPTVYVDGRLKNVDFASYISADFLSAGVTSTSTQTDSYTLRLRQAWGQAKFDNGFSILGGQMWSLVTENKASIAPSDDLGKVNDARPMTIDPGYNVGFTFARQYGLRVTQNFGDKVAIAVAIENPQGTLTTHGNGDNFLLGEAGASNSYNTTGTYTANPAPDIIVKAAFDPGFGHYEIFGLADRFTDRAFPCGETATTTTVCNGIAGPNAVGAYNASKEGGGVGANARWNFDNKHIVFGVHAFGGNGVGRYGAAQLSDISIHANGTLNLIRGYQGIGTLEWHGKKLDLYAYAGAEYASRTTDFDPITGKYVGYGSPFFKNSGCYVELPPAVDTGFTPTTLANCTGDTRTIMEGTVGFWYSFYNGPRGRFRFGTQYSYVTRLTWSGEGFSGAGAPGLSPTGLDNMVFTSFRYYLP